MQTRRLAAMAMMTALALAACDNAGEHNDADETQEEQGTQGTFQDSAAAGEAVRLPAPAGMVNPSTPPDSTPSPTTPGQPAGATPPGDSGAANTPGQ